MTVAEQAMHEGPELLTPAQLAVKLSVSKKTITKWVQLRRIPGMRRVGRLWRFYRPDVEKAMLRPTFLLPSKG
jgi:excisionase family DNA binding protein